MTAPLLAALVFAQAFYTPDEARQLFAQGAEAYERAEYERAMELWQRLADRGYGGPDVLYNLGTAALRKGDLARAVLHLERARRVGGDQDDVLANLQVARARQTDQVVGAAQDGPFLERLAHATPRDAATWTFLGLWLGGFAMVFLFRFLPPGRRTGVGVLGGLLLVLAVPTGGVLGAHVWLEERVRSGVVVVESLPARELPTGVSRISFEVHAGLKVRLLETEGRFVRIRLPNGLVGWAEREGITQI
jgi:hypothetical protein